MNKIVALGLLAALCGCNNHEPRWFSKNGKACAMVRYNDSIGEWKVVNNIDIAIFPKERDALAFARNVCGGGDIKVAVSRR